LRPVFHRATLVDEMVFLASNQFQPNNPTTFVRKRIWTQEQSIETKSKPIYDDHK
jgi:hypothetical protein